MHELHGGPILDALMHHQAAPGDHRTHLEELGLGDGLPLGGVDPERATMLTDAAALAPDEVIVVVPPLQGELTTRRLAICACLAGCGPHHMPILVAACRALGVPDLNARGVLSTTGSAALMTIVSGPVARLHHFNSGGNCLGPGNPSNASVGRCLSLVTRIVGGAREGVADMATMGQPAKYTCCFAENEPASPWTPLHADRGMDAASSAVTVLGIAGTIEAYDSGVPDVRTMVDALAWPLAGAAPLAAGAGGSAGDTYPAVLVSPEWAAFLADRGLSKRDLVDRVHERATAIAGRSVAAHSGDVLVVVAGGVGIKQTVVQGWAGRSRPVTVPVPSP